MTDSANISIVILTYQEEANIRYALDSVTWSDDVIVVDSYSTDRTEEICRSYSNVSFYQHPFDDLASQRQWALDQSLPKHPWVLALDADEVVLPELRDELVQIARSSGPDDPVAYDIAMRFAMWGRWLRRCTEYPLYWRRFFHAAHVQYVQRGHADTVDVDGTIGRTKYDLWHENRRPITDWLEKHNRYSTQEAEYFLRELNAVPYSRLLSRDRLVRRRALKRLFRNAPCGALARFLYLFVFRLGFLDGRPGFRYSMLKMFHEFVIRLKIQELQRRPDSAPYVACRVPMATAETHSMERTRQPLVAPVPTEASYSRSNPA